MKKSCIVFLVLLCLMLSACEITLPPAAETGTTTSTEETATFVTPTAEATTPTPAVKDWQQVYKGKLPELKLLFTSGAGGWSTSLEIQEDGTFSGLFHDGDMGDSGDNYPDGTRYICDFTGTFEITEVDAHTVSLKMTALTAKEEKGKVWFADNVRYIAGDAYGLAGQTEYVLYLPNTPVSALPEDTVFWNWTKLGEKTIDCFALYCPANGYTFFGN